MRKKNTYLKQPVQVCNISLQQREAVGCKKKSNKNATNWR